MRSGGDEDPPPFSLGDDVKATDHLVASMNRVMATLVSQHETLVYRLDVQEDMLNRLLKRTVPERPEFITRLQSATSTSRSEMPKQDSERPPTTSITLPSEGPPPQKRRLSLFQSRTVEDMMLKSLAVDKAAKRIGSTSAEMDLLPSWRSFLRTVVTHMGFEFFFACVIVANAIAIGVEVQDAALSSGENQDRTSFKIVSYLFIVLFILEVLAKILALGRSWAFYGWNWFDLVVVVSSLWEVVADIAQAAGGSSLMGGSSVRVIRIVQIARLARVTRIVAILKWVKGLRVLVQSIMATLKKVGWAMVLLFVIIYVFAIVFTQATADFLNGSDLDHLSDDDIYILKKYWGNLWLSMYTLYMTMTDGIHWDKVVHPLGEMSALWAVLFVAFIAWQIFAVLNVITAVFCESAMQAAQRDHDMLMHSIVTNQSKHSSKLRKLFSSIDVEQTGVITFEQLEEHIKDEKVQAFFHSLELDIWDAWSFFKLLDADGRHEIEIEEFLLGCLRLQGGAKSLDVAVLTQEQQWLSKKLMGFMNFVEEEFTQVKSCLPPPKSRHLAPAPR